MNVTEYRTASGRWVRIADGQHWEWWATRLRAEGRTLERLSVRTTESGTTWHVVSTREGSPSLHVERVEQPELPL